VVAVLVFAVLLADPPRVLLVLFGGYALSGPAKYLWQLRRRRHERARQRDRAGGPGGADSSESAGD